MVNETRSGARRRWRLLWSLIALSALLLASCGDDDDDAATDGGGADTGSSEEAAALVEQFSERPTELGITEPIDADIPTGLSLYFITCGAEACEAEADMLQQAADILEWDFTVLSTDGSPQQITAAWDQVVRDAPDGVVYTATPRSQIENQITEAAANGTSIAACCITDEIGNGILWTTSTPEQTGELGEIMAAWVVNDAAESGTENPGALYVNLPDFPILSSLATNFESSFESFCGDCTFQNLDVGLADLGDAPNSIVSEIRANADIKYVVLSTDSPFTGLRAALDAAGLDDVKIFGEGPSIANMKQIETGEQAGSMYFPFFEVMFAAVDAIARDKAGVEVIQGWAPPNWLVTADNLPTSDDYFPTIEDSVEQFTELWGK